MGFNHRRIKRRTVHCHGTVEKWGGVYPDFLNMWKKTIFDKLNDGYMN